MKKVGKNLYEVTIGNTVKANSSSIAFLWKNWHYFYQLYPEKISAKLITKDNWQAKGFNTKGEYYLTYCDVRFNSGEFDFFSIIRYRFFKSFQTKITLKYTRINAEQVSYYLTTQVKLPSLYSPFIYFLHNAADAAAVYINVIGADAASLLTKDPEVLKKKCGEEAYNLYMEFLEEEKRLAKGQNGEFVHYKPSDKKEGDDGDPSIRIFKEDVKQFEEKSSNIYRDLQSSIDIYLVNAESALVHNRTILEQITKTIVKKEGIHIEPWEANLSVMGKKLQDHWEARGQSDAHQAILIHMTTVRKFGNISAHSKAEKFLPENYKVSFIAIVTICKWYVANYKNK